MPRPCTVCDHDQRVVIDRLIGAGTASERSLAEQFGVSATAVHRHKEHVVASVRRTIERREVERDRAIASVWRERLEQTYGQAERGMERAASEDRGWAVGAKFIMAAAKLIETGLRVDGVIGENASSTVTTTCEQVLVLPRKSDASASIETAYELPEPSE